jgi:hypothetical protein
MTTYIVKEKNKLDIYQIRDDQKETFLADYGPRILVEGDSIQDAVIKFGQLPNLTELNDELNKEKSPE